MNNRGYWLVHDDSFTRVNTQIHNETVSTPRVMTYAKHTYVYRSPEERTCSLVWRPYRFRISRVDYEHAKCMFRLQSNYFLVYQYLFFLMDGHLSPYSVEIKKSVVFVSRKLGLAVKCVYRLRVAECNVLKPGSNWGMQESCITCTLRQVSQGWLHLRDTRYALGKGETNTNSQRKSLNSRSRHRRGDNIKRALKEMGYLIAWTGFIWLRIGNSSEHDKESP